LFVNRTSQTYAYSMSKKKSDQDDPDLKAIVEWEPTPDADARWAEALEMLLGEREPEDGDDLGSRLAKGM
jgi:hypothetical protein